MTCLQLCVLFNFQTCGTFPPVFMNSFFRSRLTLYKCVVSAFIQRSWRIRNWTIFNITKMAAKRSQRAMLNGQYRILNEQHWKRINIVFVVGKLGNICFERKIWVRVSGKQSKNVFDSRQKHFLFPSSKICFRNIGFPRG